MKVTYSWLKDFVEIKIRPEELADKLTMAGLEVTLLQRHGEDCVFEIEITPNRVDCLSVLGIAREVAAITNNKLKLPRSVHSLQSTVHGQRKNKKFRGLSTMDYGRLSIKIEDKIGCPYYTGRLIKDIKVGPSPDWLKKRIGAVGLRPINNIVDITNYCLIELGQPMHAFDYDKLISQFPPKAPACRTGRDQPAALAFEPVSQFKDRKIEIVIRKAKKGEKVVTIDGINRALDETILVIAAGSTGQVNKPVAIAGIMGGKITEVSSSTKNILLESAYFDPVTIRRAHRLLGLSSESSYRFERGVDPAAVLPSSDRAVQLIKDLCGGSLLGQKFAGKNFSTTNRQITFSVSQNNKILGADIKPSDAKRILNNLGFKTVAQSKDRLKVTIPSFRRDVEAGIDLVEEVARIFGYDKIKQTTPNILPSVDRGDSLRNLARLIKEILTGLGLNEIISYSLFSRDILSQLNYSVKEAIEIKNPLSREQEIMRPTLMPGLLQCLAKNLSNRLDSVKVFECSNVYVKSASGDYPGEQLSLGILISGQAANNWLRKASPLTFFDLKGLIENLFSHLGIEEFSLEKTDYPFLVKGKSVCLRLEEEKSAGFMGQIDPQILSRYDIKNKDVFLAEVSLQDMARFINLERHFHAYSIYPSIKRDLSLVVADTISQQDISRIIQEEAAGYITNIRLFDQYLGSQIPPGMRGLTLQLEYQLSERTLRDEEVDAIHKRIIQRLVDALGIQIR